MTRSARDITTLLDQLGHDSEAENELFRLVEGRFQQIAKKQMAGQRAGHTLQETALVDDAFWKLIRGQNAAWENREQFFCMAARVIRQLLVDHARRKTAVRRGSGRGALGLNGVAEPATPASSSPEHLVMLDESLSRLDEAHPDVFKVFHLHYFGGWGLAEIAEDILGLSHSSVKRRWRMAKAFLRREFAEEGMLDA